MTLTDIANMSLADKENASAPSVNGKQAVVKKAVNPLKAAEKDEPLLKDNPSRFVILPIQVLHMTSPTIPYAPADKIYSF